MRTSRRRLLLIDDKKRVGCLHAHHSNIDYIEKALSPHYIECVHFVDPGLINRVTSDESFDDIAAQRKVNEQLHHIAKSNVDAILITCTNYIALLRQDTLLIDVPIIKIDEPFFEHICNIAQRQTIVFTNPATVTGTMERLYEYAKRHNKEIDIYVETIDDAFELIMQGAKRAYDDKIMQFLQVAANENRVISVAQLSMVDAATAFERLTSTVIANPLNPLIAQVC